MEQHGTRITDPSSAPQSQPPEGRGSSGVPQGQTQPQAVTFGAVGLHLGKEEPPAHSSHDKRKNIRLFQGMKGSRD